ncbi:MAG TPA: hypothetical protein VMT85_10170 [Thermoanaerobaculia bacterium]|nr:hypothetical protein [Thermoanaerobaculia bacterium]
MAYEQIWLTLVLAALVPIAALFVVREHLKHKKRLEVRAMIHRERLAAIEKGLSPMEIQPATGDELVSGSGGVAAGLAGSSPLDLRRVGKVALGAGLVLLMGGIGYVVGFALVPETRETLGMRALAPLGAIPAMTGIGLLLFWWLLDRGEGGGGGR